MTRADWYECLITVAVCAFSVVIIGGILSLDDPPIPVHHCPTIQEQIDQLNDTRNTTWCCGDVPPPRITYRLTAEVSR